MLAQNLRIPLTGECHLPLIVATQRKGTMEEPRSSTPQQAKSKLAQNALDARMPDPRSTPEPESAATTHDPELEIDPRAPRRMPSQDNTDRRV